MKRVSLMAAAAVLALAPMTAAVAGDSSYTLDVARAIESSGGLTIEPSLQNDATFGLYENERDFFFQPWELSDIMFDRSDRLGNLHEGTEGEWNYLMWAQIANGSEQNVSSSVNGLDRGFSLLSPQDSFNAASLMHAGPGVLGISLSYLSGESTYGNSYDFGGFDESQSRDAYDVTVNWGMQATDAISWGVGLTYQSDEDESDYRSYSTPTRGFGNYADSLNLERTNIELNGGVKFKTSDTFNWNVHGTLGQPNLETEYVSDEFDDNGDLLYREQERAELDGMAYGVGADFNWYLDKVDYEVQVGVMMEDYDWDPAQFGTFLDVQAGETFVDTLIQRDDISSTEYYVRGKAMRPVGKSALYYGLGFMQRTTEVDLGGAWSAENPEDTQFDESGEIDTFVIELPVGTKIPITDWLAFVGGAAYRYVDSEDKVGYAEEGFSQDFKASDTYGDTAMRLGFQILLKNNVALDVLWSEGFADSFGRNTVDNQEFAFAATFNLGS